MPNGLTEFGEQLLKVRPLFGLYYEECRLKRIESPVSRLGICVRRQGLAGRCPRLWTYFNSLAAIIHRSTFAPTSSAFVYTTLCSRERCSRMLKPRQTMIPLPSHMSLFNCLTANWQQCSCIAVMNKTIDAESARAMGRRERLDVNGITKNVVGRLDGCCRSILLHRALSNAKLTAQEYSHASNPSPSLSQTHVHPRIRLSLLRYHRSPASKRG